MLSITELKTGVKIEYQGAPFEILKSEHAKLGRGGGIQRVVMKNLLDGTVLNINFKTNDKFEAADLRQKSAQYLYRDDSGAYFMSGEDYEQFSLPLPTLGAARDYLKEGADYQIQYYKDRPVAVELPIKMTLEVTVAPPGLKGDRANAGTKAITLETGAVVQAPLFIKPGDKIIVDTRTGTYVERGKE